MRKKKSQFWKKEKRKKGGGPAKTNRKKTTNGRGQRREKQIPVFDRRRGFLPKGEENTGKNFPKEVRFPSPRQKRGK